MTSKAITGNLGIKTFQQTILIDFSDSLTSYFSSGNVPLKFLFNINFATQMCRIVIQNNSYYGKYASTQASKAL